MVDPLQPIVKRYKPTHPPNPTHLHPTHTPSLDDIDPPPDRFGALLYARCYTRVAIRALLYARCYTRACGASERYMLNDKALLVNRFISVPRDLGDVNCGAWGNPALCWRLPVGGVRAKFGV